MSISACVRVRVHEYICTRARESVRICMWMRVFVCAQAFVCARVCMGERERERECVNKTKQLFNF